MSEAVVDITGVCETWRARITDATRNGQQQYARELLGLLGWEQPAPFTPLEAASSLSALPFLLRAPEAATVAAYFVLPGTLEAPSPLIERGLDFCAATRRLVEEAQTLNVGFALITDLHRAYLYDVRSEELMLAADHLKALNAEVAPVLHRERLSAGSLNELRRQPRSAAARQLREWMQRWTDTIAARGGVSEETASLALDRLLVIRYLFEHDILRRTRWRLQQRFRELSEQASGARPAGVGNRLVQLFHDMWFDWKMDLFEGMPELDRVLSDDAVSAPLLSEFALLSRGKFDILTILESFNFGEPAEKMRVRMVPDDNEERELYLEKQTLATVDRARIEIDLLEEGYRAIFHWFDKVVGLYERLGLDFDSHARQDAEPGHDLDLFAWGERDARRPGACGDALAHACATGFGVFYTTRRQLRIARLLLTLHLVRRYDDARRPLDAFPSLSNVLHKRPQVLSAERVMNPRSADDSFSGVRRVWRE